MLQITNTETEENFCYKVRRSDIQQFTLLSTVPKSGCEAGRNRLNSVFIMWETEGHFSTGSGHKALLDT